MSKEPPTTLTQAASVVSGGPSLAEEFLTNHRPDLASDPAAREVALAILSAFTNYARQCLQDRVLAQVTSMGLGKDAPHHPDIPRGGVVVPKPGGYTVPLERSPFQIVPEEELAARYRGAVVHLSTKSRKGR